MQKLIEATLPFSNMFPENMYLQDNGNYMTLKSTIFREFHMKAKNAE